MIRGRPEGPGRRPGTEWCRVQLFDLIAAWDAADGAERTRLAGGLFERIEAQRETTWNIRLANGAEVHDARQLEDFGLAIPSGDQPAVGGVEVVAVPREGWRRFFEYVVLERETGFEPATSTLARLRSTE